MTSRHSTERSTPVAPLATPQVRDVVNAVLHAGAKPCQTACTHVIIGRWTALGIANTIARADIEDSL